MRFYLDSANIDEIKKAKDLPFFAGVTTNPSLISKEGIKNLEKFYRSLLLLLPSKELFVQVFSKEADAAYREAIDLAGLSRERVIIKIPVSNEMIDVAYRLSDKGIRVCLTAVSSIRQIAIAGILNIEFCAIYLNRLLKDKKPVYKEIMEADEMISNRSLKTRILVASLPDEKLIEPILKCRNLDYTLPFKPFMSLLKTDESEKWIKSFYEVNNKNSIKR